LTERAGSPLLTPIPTGGDILHKCLTPLVAALLAALSAGKADAAPARALTIGWNDLRAPADAGTSAGDASQTLSWNLRGKTIEIAGYVLPSDREGDLVYQFVLIPWTGLCSHVAPPPPNQAVLITLKTPFKLAETYQTVSVTGVLEPELEKTQLFMLDGVSVIESGYRISGAQVAPEGKVTGATEKQGKNPWGFLKK
jgi:hypothetical protein